MVGLNEFALHVGLWVNPFSLQDKSLASQSLLCVLSWGGLGDGLLSSDSGHPTNQSAFVSLIGCMFIQLHTETVLSVYFELGISLAVPGYLNLKS